MTQSYPSLPLRCSRVSHGNSSHGGASDLIAPPNLTEPTKIHLIRAQHVHLGGPWKCILQVLPPVLCHGLFSVSYPPTRRVLAHINPRTGAQLCVIHPLQPATHFNLQV
jgi:hypothetical protein